jgi:hypothetical protein
MINRTLISRPRLLPHLMPPLMAQETAAQPEKKPGQNDLYFLPKWADPKSGVDRERSDAANMRTRTRHVAWRQCVEGRLTEPEAGRPRILTSSGQWDRRHRQRRTADVRR